MLLSRSDFSSSSPVPTSRDVDQIDNSGGEAGNGAHGTSLNSGGGFDDGDQKLIFLLLLDCRQWMSQGGVLVCGAPIRREPLPLSASHSHDSVHYTDALPIPLSSSVSPSMPTAQLVSRYGLNLNA